MAGIRLEGNLTGLLAEVNTRNELTVNLPYDDASKAGYASIVCESDPGVKTGDRYVKAPEVSEDYRMRVGLDTLTFNDTFNYTAQNTSNYAYRATAGTNCVSTVWSVGRMTLTGFTGGAGTYPMATSIQGYRSFPLIGSTPIYYEANIALSATPPASWQAEFGFMLLGTGSPYAATDGAYFIINSSGVSGMLMYNGTPTPLAFLSAATLGTANHKYTVVVDERHVEFWIDDVLYLDEDTPTNQGQPFASGSAPIGFRLYQSADPGAVCSVQVGDVTVALADWGSYKPWQHQMAAQGQMAYQVQNGTASITAPFYGMTASYQNSNPPGGAQALLNSATTTGSAGGAGGGQGLGGQAQFLVQNTAVTDGIVSQYLNPAGSVGTTGRILHITGCKISAVNLISAAITSGIVIAWSIAFGARGGTAPDLSVVESATSKAYRRIPMGFMTWLVGAAIGAGPQNGDLTMRFDSPIVVNPGEYLVTVAKFVLGTVNGSETIMAHVTFDGYFE